jgi:signal transduction histidine kinase
MLITPVLSMSKRIAALVCVLFILTDLHAQRREIDSFATLLRNHPENDSIRVFLLSELAFKYHQVHPDSTKYLAKEAYRLAIKLNYEKGKADAMKHLAIGSYLSGDFDSAVYYNKQSLLIYEKIGEKRGKGAVLNNIAMVLHDQGFYGPALTYYRQSLKLRLENKDDNGIAGCYNNIGNVYSDMGNYSEALHNLYKALQIREKMSDTLNIAQSLSNIARIYLLLGKQEQTLRYAERSYKLFQELQSIDGLALASSNIGGVYHERNDHKRALECFNTAKRYYEEMQNYPGLLVALVNAGEELTALNQLNESKKLYIQALALATEGQDQEGIAISHIGLGLISLKEGKVKESIVSLNKGLLIAQKIGSKLRISEASKHLASAYEHDRDFENSNKALHTYVAYKDSLFIEESAKKAEELQFNFMLDKKQKEIALLEKDRSLQEKENEKQRLISLSLVTVLVLLLLGLFFLVKNNEKEKRSKKLILEQKNEIEKQARSLEELNELKDKTFSVLSHDLRSPVSSLIGVITLMEEKMLSPDEFNALQATFSTQLKSLGYMLDNLLYWSKSHMTGGRKHQVANVHVSQVIDQNTDLVKEIASQKNITMDISGVHDVVVKADRDDIDIVMRNLLSNAVKFTNANGIIRVRAQQSGGFVTVEVQDDGIGMDAETISLLFSNNPKKATYGTQGEKGTGIGLLICREFIEKNGGVLQVQSEPGKGATFSFTLPAV